MHVADADHAAILFIRLKHIVGDLEIAAEIRVVTTVGFLDISDRIATVVDRLGRRAAHLVGPQAGVIAAIPVVIAIGPRDHGNEGLVLLTAKWEKRRGRQSQVGTCSGQNRRAVEILEKDAARFAWLRVCISLAIGAVVVAIVFADSRIIIPKLDMGCEERSNRAAKARTV